MMRTAVLMFQREFALRMTASAGSKMWCRLAANVQLFARVEHIMKVGKGNFRPPPQVESSVVRMSPKNPPPPVAFEEFDGLNRIIFSRMNKTIRGTFSAKGVKEMLERNYRTWCAENGKVSRVTVAEERKALSEGRRLTRQIVEDDFDMKVKIEETLVESGFAESRAAKMDVDDLLK
jgi:18S rRNA (adenine1779-N6/adenine1780-N6)-dimethyltransferase